jgi:Cu+-exporting ATPase
MEVDRASARHFHRYEGEKAYFCSAGCKAQFESEPRRYLCGRPVPPPFSGGTQYTCPMHPEIVRDPAPARSAAWRLNRCAPTGEEGPNPELVDFTRRLRVFRKTVTPVARHRHGAEVGLPVRDWIGEPLAAWLELGLATPIVLWAAIPFFHRGYESFVNRSPNMWTLISIGVGTAYIYSVVATFFPERFPPQFRSHGGSVPVYFEAAAVIVALVFLGQPLELP